ncbi:albumin B-like [Rhinophrynus dorsalis]
MKWVTLICLLICTSLIESRNVFKRDAEPDTIRHIDDVFKTLQENNFRAVVQVMVSQNLQKSSLEELTKLVDQIDEFAKSCVANDKSPECEKPLATTLFDKICTVPDLNTKYDFSAECCGKPDPERGQCFRDHRVHIPVKDPEPEETCREFKENPQHVLAQNLVRESQRYPKASFGRVQKIAHEFTHFFEECCHGNTVECLVERLEFMQHLCENHEEVSTKLHKCCEKHFLERSYCIVNLENDDVPADLSLHVTEYIEDPKVCEHYAEKKDVFLASFLYEYSRRHPELSIELLLRIARGYEDLLNKCCKTDNPPECYKDALSLIIGRMCERQKITFINNNLAHCCNVSYSDRQPCFNDLGVDESYVPPALGEETFQFGEDLCTAPVEKLPKMKQRYIQ